MEVDLIRLVVWVVVLGLVFWILFWGIGKIGLPEPFNKIAIAIIVLVAVIILINFLLGLTGSGPVIRMR